MDRPTRWTWGTDGGADRVWAELDGPGLSWFHDPAVLDAIETDAHGVAARVLGRRPYRLQPDRLELVPGPHRGYQKTSGPALFHIDPDPYLPPEIQLLACARPAADGGDSTFLDSWQLVRAIEAEDPALFARLFTAVRTIGFSHNRWFGPTVARRLDQTMVVHGAMPIADGDTVGAALLARIKASPPMTLRLAHGDVLVASNHRLLHGRTAFADPSRLLFRLLLWVDGRLSAPVAYVTRAAEVHARLTAQLADQPAWIQARLGVFPDGVGASDAVGTPPRAPDAASAERLAELTRVVDALRLDGVAVSE